MGIFRKTSGSSLQSLNLIMAAIETLDVFGKAVLLRVDFNVPLSKSLEVTDDTRIRRALPTIEFLKEKGAKIILLSHLGRPLKKLLDDGNIDVKRFSLKNVIPKLSELLGQRILFNDNHCDKEISAKLAKMNNGDVLLVENTRFSKDETKGGEGFAKHLSTLADCYVNDAFGTAHRAHSSTAIVAKYFRSEQKAFGFLMQEEIRNATKILNESKSPVTAIIGGAKVSDKIKLIENLLAKVDHILIGGGMAYTFLKAKGGDVGNSLVEDDYLNLAAELLEKAQAKGVKIHLPADSKCADAFSEDANKEVRSSMEIGDGWMGLDIGPMAMEAYRNVVLASKTILWNGPMGVFEFSSFSQGTFTVAKSVADATTGGAFSLIGGGDSVAAINKSGLAEKVSFVSTGGGAMLEFLEGKTLPGVQAILD